MKFVLKSSLNIDQKLVWRGMHFSLRTTLNVNINEENECFLAQGHIEEENE